MSAESMHYWALFSQARDIFINKIQEQYYLVYSNSSGSEYGYQFRVGDVLENNRLFVYISNNVSISAEKRGCCVRAESDIPAIAEWVMESNMINVMDGYLNMLHELWREDQFVKTLAGSKSTV